MCFRHKNVSKRQNKLIWDICSPSLGFPRMRKWRTRPISKGTKGVWWRGRGGCLTSLTHFAQDKRAISAGLTNLVLVCICKNQHLHSGELSASEEDQLLQEAARFTNYSTKTERFRRLPVFQLYTTLPVETICCLMVADQETHQLKLPGNTWALFYFRRTSRSAF